MKYKISLEGTRIIQYIEIPVLVVSNNRNDTAVKILVGNEISAEESKQEITVLRPDVMHWIRENIVGKYDINGLHILFELEEEAILFKTVWI